MQVKQQGKPHPGMHQTQHDQLIKSDNYPAVFNTGVTSSASVALCVVLGLTI